jgi:hypothetical protein
MKIVTLNPKKPEKVQNFWTRSLYRVEGTLAGSKGYGLGIDPGVNFGVTFIRNENVMIYYGTMKRAILPGEYGVIAVDLLQSLPEFRDMKGNCVIEGAAFHKTFGQVGLAEVREGFYIAARMTGDLSTLKQARIVPPATIRKVVTGDGRTQAGDCYPVLNHNAADSIFIAQYALTL